LTGLQNAKEINSDTHGKCGVESRRAQRFEVRVAVRFRVANEQTWRRGETANISSSGVLFRSRFDAECGTFLDLRLTMSSMGADGVAEIACSGVVVRSVLAEQGELPAVAVRIRNIRLSRA
jgi:hypothetical protein